MLRKVLFLFIIISVIILFEECSKFKTFDCGNPPPYFLIKSMKAKHGVKAPRSNQVKSLETTEITIDTAEEYHIFCVFDVGYTASAKPGISSMFINSAFATEPCESEGYMGPKYPITDIRITSNADYDSTHRKGTILNRFFREPYKTTVTDSLQVSDFDFYSQGFSIVCAEKPSLDLKHIFKVEITLSNGDKFSGETPPATFKKR